ncbi:Trimethyllysine dioxygenase [Lojkania enalia]|uniref:Trimethyllysine dioxygenase n=1 Tax=Lojkania enalia TaxID=147567 RepID=A0A9P4KJ29_9PLEO|nr:Trimethyllysine dioxygenase [Didymosphaeria enalia]
MNLSPNIWLRDNCQCSTCVHPATRQRLLHTFQIPQDIAIDQFEDAGDSIKVKWSDGHESQYTQDFLSLALANSKQMTGVRQGTVEPELWGARIKDNPPIAHYDNAMGNDGGSILPVLSNIRRYGFSYIDYTPASPQATEELLSKIAFIRETHYGAFYDFTADLASKDTAYTNIALDAHTDTTYFSDPAGLQAFHLLSHTDGEGGASLLVDGFKVARELQKEDPEAYNILATVNVHAHASGNDGISIQPYRGFPVFQHDPDSGLLVQVRWNNSDRARIELPVDQVKKWYDAARKWDALLKKKENEYWEQLTPGRVLIFDNWRVLHGRSAFTGKRRICGGYINRDDWISKYKILQFGQEEVLKHLATN